MKTEDQRIRHSDPAERNRQPILAVLERVLPKSGVVLEIASGTGQHVVGFAQSLPDLHWLPSDPDVDARESIAARIDDSGLENVDAPLDLDVLESWPVPFVDAVITANLLHISPIETLAALCEGAANVLRPNGLLHIYGPFKRHGAQTAQSNARFDASLRERNPAWGIRDLEKVVDTALRCGFKLEEVVDMPANNFSLVFRLTE